MKWQYVNLLGLSILFLISPDNSIQTPKSSPGLVDTTLDQLKGTARPLLVFSASNLDTLFQKQLDSLRISSAQEDFGANELAERRVVLIPILNSGNYVPNRASLFRTIPIDEATRIRREFDVKPGEFRTVLIGTDGTVKGVWRKPIELQSILKLIDSMPGRQREKLDHFLIELPSVPDYLWPHFTERKAAIRKLETLLILSSPA